MTDYSLFRALAYVNHGRWLADCPRPGCGNALELNPRQTEFHCRDRTGLGSCGLRCEVVWPLDVQEITDELGKRPVPSTRNWAPEGHWQAISTGPQTVKDLQDEFYQNDPGSAEYAKYMDEYDGRVHIGGGIHVGEIRHTQLRQIES